MAPALLTPDSTDLLRFGLQLEHEEIRCLEGAMPAKQALLFE